MGNRVVKIIAPVAEFGSMESRAAIRAIDMKLITTALSSFGGLEITNIIDHDLYPDPSDRNHQDTGFSITMQTTDSRHRTFVFDDLIDAMIYPDPPGEDQVSVTEQVYFGTYGTGYVKGKPNLSYTTGMAFNMPGNYTWSDVGYERYIMVYLDDSDNIIGLSNIRMDSWANEEQVMFIDYAKDMIYMTNGFMNPQNAGTVYADSWIAKMNERLPLGKFVYDSLIGHDDRAAKLPVMLKNPSNSFIKYEGEIEFECFGLDSVYSGYNYSERILVGEQKYIHVGNNNLFLPYDTYEEVEIENE